MKTELVQFDDIRLANWINDCEVVAFPTETVFGIGVVYDSKEAFDKLVIVKERNPDKPFTVMISDKKDIDLFATYSNKVSALIETFMPGEITLILDTKENIYPWVSLNHKTIGIRISAKKEVCDLISRVGKPMLVTSANISNHAPAQNSMEAYQIFNAKIKAIVEGESNSGLPSTIVDCSNNQLKLLREGSITFEEIKRIWEDVK